MVIKAVNINDKFHAEIQENGKVLFSDLGSVKIGLQSSDRNTELQFDDIEFDSFIELENGLEFSVKIPVPELIIFLEVKVRYEVLSEKLLKKTIITNQRNAPKVFYSLRNEMKPSKTPDKFFTFENFVYDADVDLSIERFHSLGFAFGDRHFGMVNESGFVNRYVRNKKKRKIVDDFGYDAFEPFGEIPDANILEVSDNLVAFNFGQVKRNGKLDFYNTLDLGKPDTKTVYYFADDIKNIRELKITSQNTFSEGRGFVGGTPEKILYADSRINYTIAGIDDFTPHSVPAPVGYAPDMYNRDTFWTTVATRDKELNIRLCERFWDTQDDRGCIGTIITPVTGSIEVKDNESTILMVLWALMNYRRFGHLVSKEKLDAAINYCMDAFDPEREGVCRAHFALSQQDISYYENNEELCVNQGMYAVFLRAAKELGYDIADEYIEKSEKAYVSYYNESDGSMSLMKGEMLSTTIDNLIPEFLSLWMFDYKMLTDEQVKGFLSNYPGCEYDSVLPIFIRRDGDYFELKDWPFKENEYNPISTYYNGGSWMRQDICAYAVGMAHGMGELKEKLEKRLWAELDRFWDDPVSHEFLPTSSYYEYNDWIRNNSVFSWNVFSLAAMELAGLRKPDDDTDTGREY